MNEKKELQNAINGFLSNQKSKFTYRNKIELFLAVSSTVRLMIRITWTDEDTKKVKREEGWFIDFDKIGGVILPQSLLPLKKYITKKMAANAVSDFIWSNPDYKFLFEHYPWLKNFLLG